MGAVAMTRPRGVRSLRGDTRGFAAVEFAMVGLALFLVSFAAIDLGMMLWIQGALEAVAADAARCGAIAASGCTTTNGVQTYAQGQTAIWINSAIGPNLTINVNSAVDTSKCPAIGTGTYETVQIIAANLNSWLPPPLSSYVINVCASYAM